ARGQGLRPQGAGAVPALQPARRAGHGDAGRIPRRHPRQLRPGGERGGDREVPGRSLRGPAAAGQVPVQVPGRGRQGREGKDVLSRTSLTTALALVLPTLLVGGALVGSGALNWGQVACWLAFLSALTAGFGWFAALLGHERAGTIARTAFRVQWGALLGGAVLLWWLLTTTLGLVLLRLKSPLTKPAMFFLNLPVIMLTFVGVVRGPFLASRAVYTDGAGLNPL